MAARQPSRRAGAPHPGTSTTSEVNTTRDDPKTTSDEAPASGGVAVQADGVEPPPDPLQLMEARFTALENRIVQQFGFTDSGGESETDNDLVQESDWDDRSAACSRSTSPAPVKLTKRITKRAVKNRCAVSEPEVSDGDKYARARKREGLKRKLQRRKHKKHKHRKTSSSSSSSSSSDGIVDSDTQHKGVMATECASASEKREMRPEAKIRVCTLMRTALEGHFHTFKPLETIDKGAERYTGVKGVEATYPREMDVEVQIPDDKRKHERTLLAIQRGLLAGLTAILPVANRMLVENRFTSLAKDLNAGIELLAATSTYITYRRYENIFKAVTTDAGKEVTRSKKVKDKNGKEFTVFLAPKPIKGRDYDKKLMFGGQLTQLLKQVESGSKCGKQMGQAKNSHQMTQGRSRKFRNEPRRRPQLRGGRSQYGQFRQRGGFRQSFGWTENNRAANGYRPPTPAAAAKTPGFQRGGTK